MKEIQNLITKELVAIDEQLSNLNFPDNNVFIAIKDFTKEKSKKNSFRFSVIVLKNTQ